MTVSINISAIYRYPVKGLSPEVLQRVALAPGECLPQDRRFAVALPATRFDPERPEWLSKTHFVMLMRDEKLAELDRLMEGILKVRSLLQTLVKHCRCETLEECGKAMFLSAQRREKSREASKLLSC